MIKGLRCGNCGKGIMYGHNVSHAKNRTRKIFKPNLHNAKIVVNGIGKRMKLCTKCLRILKGKMQKEVKTEAQVSKPEEQPQPLVAA